VYIYQVVYTGLYYPGVYTGYATRVYMAPCYPGVYATLLPVVHASLLLPVVHASLLLPVSARFITPFPQGVSPVSAHLGTPFGRS